jgi:hypothetical protein
MSDPTLSSTSKTADDTFRQQLAIGGLPTYGPSKDATEKLAMITQKLSTLSPEMAKKFYQEIQPEVENRCSILTSEVGILETRSSNGEIDYQSAVDGLKHIREMANELYCYLEVSYRCTAINPDLKGLMTAKIITYLQNMRLLHNIDTRIKQMSANQQLQVSLVEWEKGQKGSIESNIESFLNLFNNGKITLSDNETEDILARLIKHLGKSQKMVRLKATRIDALLSREQLSRTDDAAEKNAKELGQLLVTYPNLTVINSEIEKAIAQLRGETPNNENPKTDVQKAKHMKDELDRLNREFAERSSIKDDNGDDSSSRATTNYGEFGRNATKFKNEKELKGMENPQTAAFMTNSVIGAQSDIEKNAVLLMTNDNRTEVRIIGQGPPVNSGIYGIAAELMKGVEGELGACVKLNQFFIALQQTVQIIFGNDKARVSISKNSTITLNGKVFTVTVNNPKAKLEKLKLEDPFIDSDLSHEDQMKLWLVLTKVHKNMDENAGDVAMHNVYTLPTPESAIGDIGDHDAYKVLVASVCSIYTIDQSKKILAMKKTIHQFFAALAFIELLTDNGVLIQRHRNSANSKNFGKLSSKWKDILVDIIKSLCDPTDSNGFGEEEARKLLLSTITKGLRIVEVALILSPGSLLSEDMYDDGKMAFTNYSSRDDKMTNLSATLMRGLFHQKTFGCILNYFARISLLTDHFFELAEQTGWGYEEETVKRLQKVFESLVDNDDIQEHIEIIEKHTSGYKAFVEQKFTDETVRKIQLLRLGKTAASSQAYAISILKHILADPNNHDKVIDKTKRMVDFVLNSGITYKKEYGNGGKDPIYIRRVKDVNEDFLNRLNLGQQERILQNKRRLEDEGDKIDSPGKTKRIKGDDAMDVGESLESEPVGEDEDMG